MSSLDRIFTAALLLIIGAVYILLPSINIDSFMNGTQSGKTFVFLTLVIILGIVLFMHLLFFNRIGQFLINILDVFLIIWCLYVILNINLQNVPFSLRLFEFYGLIILYIVLRLIHWKYLLGLYIALILGCGIQEAIGLLQFLGYYPSNHELFRVTGSFFNPGPYAGFLATVFPVLFGLFLFNSHSVKKEFSPFFLKLTNYFSTKSLVLISIICIILILSASKSCAAWLAVLVSSFYLVSLKVGLYRRFKAYFDTLKKRIFLLVAFIIILSISAAGLYQLKSGSVEGRKLIWKICMNMIKDKPVLGYGFDQFKAHYMDYQAAYFEHNQASEEAMVAGDTNYAFNEFLQLTVENGIPGLVIIVSILIIIFMSSSFREYEIGSKSQTENLLGVVAKAGIISIIVFGLFSYPSQILPIKLNMVLFLATVASLRSEKEDSLFFTLNRRRVQLLSLHKIFFSIAGLLLVSTGGKFLFRSSKAYSSWNEAYMVYQMGAYEACLENYEKSWPVLKSNGNFLTDYGKALSMAGKHNEAVEVLLRASNYYPNIVVYTSLGDSYKQMGEIWHAEQAYLHAWYMNPSRFYSKYLLAKLYDENGQKEKAILTAKELLTKQIKVPSTTIDEIIEEMQNIIIQNKGKNDKE